MRYKKPNNKKKLLAGAVAAVLIIVVLLALELSGVTNFYTKPKDATTSDQTGINYGPPTEEEQSAGDEKKDEIVENENTQPPPDNPSAKTANVIITDAGQYDSVIEVRSFINDHYEDGTCTIKFTLGSQTVSKDTPAYRDASTTICTNPLFQRSEFPSAGDWQVTVSYKSAGATGQSTPQTVKIN